MKRIFGGTLVLAALLCASLSAQGPGADDQNKALLAEIEAAWKRQEEAFKEVEIEWKEEVFIRKGSHSSDEMLAISKMLVQDTENIIPPADLLFNLNRKLLARGSEMRIDYTIPVWNKSTRMMSLIDQIASFGGNVSRSYSLKSSPNPSALHGSASIRSLSHFPNAVHPANRPILAAVRPLNPAFRQAYLAEMMITGKTMTIDGFNCIECREHRSTSQTSYSLYWLDQHFNYLPRRITMHHAGRTRLKIGIDYKASLSECYIPSKWEIVCMDIDPNKVSESYRGKVTSVKKKFEEAIFPPLPIGTQVFDDRMPPGKQLYLVDENENKHTVTAKSLVLSHNDRVQEMMDKKKTESWYGSFGYYVLLLLAGCGLILIFVRGLRSRLSKV
jgi:hypothetical protein